MASTHQLPSGRYRGHFRTPSGRQVTKSFDYEYEAREWAEDGERRAQAAVADAEAPEAPTTAEPEAPEATTPPEADGPTVTSYGLAWCDRIDGSLEASTVNGYRTHLRSMERTGLGGRPLGSLRRPDVQQWVTDQKGTVTASTINARVKVLGMVLRDAVDEGLAPYDATHRVRRPTPDTVEKEALTPDEVRLVLKAAKASDNPTLYPMALLGLYCGLRWQESAALPGHNVHPRRVHVGQVIDRGTGKVRPGTKSGRDKVRNVPLPSLVAEVLEPLTVTDGLLFTNADGKELDYHNWLRRAWYPMLADAGLEPFGPHVLRHTYGTALADANTPRHRFAKWMGHADERTTAIYVHARDTDADADTVDAIFGP